MVEQMHPMLSHGIVTLTNSNPYDWDKQLAQTLFTIWTCTHAVTCFSPFKLIYGVEPHLPINSEPPQFTDPSDLDVVSEECARLLELMSQDCTTTFKHFKNQAEYMHE